MAGRAAAQGLKTGDPGLTLDLYQGVRAGAASALRQWALWPLIKGFRHMIGYPDAPKAWWLTREMARISGVDLPRAVVEGWLQRAELEALVVRCVACGRTAGCETWLAKPGAAQAIPDFCPNRPAITALGGWPG